ncbi:hypothetical protein Q9Q99_02745 [Curtobacterium flaccumfaciens]|nr:hypothetical protein Q9Q99_02745 [Curtobacterium flaccumfaciens]
MSGVTASRSRRSSSGATLTLFGIIVPLFLGGAGFFDLDLQL